MRYSTTRFIAILGVVTLPALLLVAAESANASTSPSRNAIHTRLLKASNLPSGWKASASQSSTLDLPKSTCLSALPTKSTANTQSASASFADRSGLPSLGEYLATGLPVSSKYEQTVQVLNDCHTLTFKSDKRSIRATISPFTVAAVGSGSAAYSLRFAISGFLFVTDIVVFHTTKYLGELIYTDSVAPLSSTVETLSRAAADKAEGKSVTASNISVVTAPVRVAHTSLGDVGYRMIGVGPPLVLIMGYSGTMEVWDPQLVDALSVHHTVIIFDNAGVGKTHMLASPLTIDSMADQTAALINTLGFEKPDVLGWSMGGMIAQALAVEHPALVGRLVLCSTYPGTGTLKPPQAAINDLKSTSPTKAFSVLFPPGHGVATEAYGLAIGNYPPSSTAPQSVVNAQTQAVDTWFDGRDVAGKRTTEIQVPTLVADGDADRLDNIANDQRLTSLIPNSRLLLYPDAGHAFLFQDEAAFVPVVDAFLSPATPRSAS